MTTVGRASQKKLLETIPRDTATLSDSEALQLIKQQGDRQGISDWEIQSLIGLCESKNCLQVGIAVLSEYATLQDQVTQSFNLQRGGFQELINYINLSESDVDIIRVSEIILPLSIHILTFYVSLCRWRKLQWSPHSFLHVGVDVLDADAYTLMIKNDIESLMQCLKVSGLMSELIRTNALELAIVTFVSIEEDGVDEIFLGCDDAKRNECIEALRDVFRNEEKIGESWKSCANNVDPTEKDKLLDLFPTLRLPYSNVQSPINDMDWFLSSLHVYNQAVITLEGVFAVIREKHHNDASKSMAQVLDTTQEILTSEEQQEVMMGEEIGELTHLDATNDNYNDNDDNDDDDNDNDDGKVDENVDEEEDGNDEIDDAISPGKSGKKKKRRKKKKKTKLAKQIFRTAVNKVNAVNKVTANTFTRKVDTVPGLQSSSSKSSEKISKMVNKVGSNIGSRVSKSTSSISDRIRQVEDDDSGPNANAKPPIQVIRRLEMMKSENLVFIQNIQPLSNQTKTLIDENEDLVATKDLDVEAKHKSRRNSQDATTKAEILTRRFSSMRIPCFEGTNVNSVVSSPLSRAEAKAESHIMDIALRNIRFDNNHIKTLAAKKIQAWLKIYLPIKIMSNKNKSHRDAVRIIKKMVSGLLDFVEIECQRRNKKRRTIKRNLAAIKIQRLYKTYSKRKSLLEQSKVRTEEDSLHEMSLKDTSVLDEIEAAAAIKIQCCIRSSIARKVVIRRRESFRLFSHKLFEDKMNEMMIRKLTRTNALILMQKLWRGYNIRKILLKKMKAAYEILVCYRTYKSRRHLKQSLRRLERPSRIILNSLRGIPDAVSHGSQLRVKISVWWHPLLHIVGENSYSTIISTKKPQFLHVTAPVNIYKPVLGSLESIEYVSSRGSGTEHKGKKKEDCPEDVGRKSVIAKKNTMARKSTINKSRGRVSFKRQSKIERVSINSMLSMYDEEEDEEDDDSDEQIDSSPDDQIQRRKSNSRPSLIMNVSLKSMYDMYNDEGEDGGTGNGSHSGGSSSDEEEFNTDVNSSSGTKALPNTKSSFFQRAMPKSFVDKIRSTMQFSKQATVGNLSSKNSCKFDDLVVYIPTCHGNSLLKFEFLDGETSLGNWVFNMAKYGDLMYWGGEYSSPVELEQGRGRSKYSTQSTKQSMMFDYEIKTYSPRKCKTQWVKVFVKKKGGAMSLLNAFIGRWERQFLTYDGQTLLFFGAKSDGAPVMEILLFEELESVRCEFGNPTSTNFGKSIAEDGHNVILTLMNEEIYLRFSDLESREHWMATLESVVYQKNLRELAAQGIVLGDSY